MSTPDFDLFLGDAASPQGYRCNSFVRDSAPLISPRFSTGEQGQTDLDLLKSASVDNLTGGMFQRMHIDPTKVARALGFSNPFDESFYPTLPTASASGSFTAGTFACKAESESYGFVCFNQRSGGFSYNLVTKVAGSVGSLLSMPAAISGLTAQTKVSNMCIHKDYLFLAAAPKGYTAAHSYRYNINAATWQDISGNMTLFFTLRGSLYGVQSGGDLYSVTNETAAGAATFTLIASVGGADIEAERAIEFNGAAWITKADGLYRFDGVTTVKVLNMYAKHITVWNGSMYFMVGNWLYRFNGALVEKLQYFEDTIYQISSNGSYLFLQTWVITSNIDSPKIPSGSGFARIYAFDGVGWSVALEKDLTVSGIDHALVCSSSILVYVQPQFSGTSWSGSNTYCIDLTTLFTSAAITSASQLDITSSEDDDQFPNIYKSLETVEVNYSDLISGDVLTVKYQLYDGKAWGSWQTLGTIDSTSTSNYLEVSGSTNKLYKRIKINVYASTVAAGSTIKLQGFSWRFTLQPRIRWRWQVQLMAEGNGIVTTRNNTPISDDSNALNNAVTKAIKQKTPIFMFSPDYGVVDAQIDSDDLTLVVAGQLPIYTDPYLEFPFVAVKNNSSVWEILRVSAASYNSDTDKTTLTLIERGYYGITADQINAGGEFHLAYKVYVTRLLRDATILDPSTYNEQSTGESQLQREFMLELTEV